MPCTTLLPKRGHFGSGPPQLFGLLNPLTGLQSWVTGVEEKNAQGWMGGMRSHFDSLIFIFPTNAVCIDASERVSGG